MKNRLFEPYLKEINNARFRADNIWFCIPKKLGDSIKEGTTMYICPKCAESMQIKNLEHCTKSSNVTINITRIENWFLTEINNKETNKINFRDRQHLINFLEINYGNIQCNESLLLIGAKIE